MPRVSVVVPVRDQPRELGRLLVSLERQTLPRDAFEVVVADDGSRTSLREIVSGTDLRVRLIEGEPVHSFAARERAARAASADLLAFTDADAQPDPAWLETGLARAADDVLIAGHVGVLLPDRPTIWTLLDLGAYHDQAALVRERHAVTANLFVPRRMFERVGGFDTRLASWADFDLTERCVAAGATLRYCDDCVVRHPTKDTARSHLRKLWTDDRAFAQRMRLHGTPVRRLAVRWTPPGELWFRAARRMPLAVDRRRAASLRVPTHAGHALLALGLRLAVLPSWRALAHVAGYSRPVSQLTPDSLRITNNRLRE